MTRPRVMYMHLIHNNPARWDAQDGRLYIVHRYGRSLPATLHASLREIRRQQQASIRYRGTLGIADNPSDYGYVRVQVPR